MEPVAINYREEVLPPGYGGGYATVEFIDGTEVRTAIVDTHLSDREKLPVTIHEALHCVLADWLPHDLHERAASSVGALLWELGYRRRC
jgi:hypothetical protein